ncbi:MAG: hydroxypyruvate isomerase [Kiritimatiellia bacterium]|jgi:hydroxypyruvate isomerase
MNRRDLFKTAALGTVGVTLTSQAQAPKSAADPHFKITNNRIKQSVMGWCFKPMSAADLIPHCAEIGLKGIEGISPNDYPLAKEHGLEISLVGSHSFKDGPADPAKHDMVVKKMTEAIDTAKKFGAKRVITFTGFVVDGMGPEQMTKNCVEGWKKVVGYAEKNDIIICFEHLNTRDDTHPMKGHPGYFGDDVDHCIEMIKQVDSPNFKLLFDIYHVSIMNGDVIRRMHEYKDYIGHLHTAGNPGRAELTDNQEINYPAVMKTALEIGFDGFVAQEFIPVWDDKILALRHGCAVCDV